VTAAQNYICYDGTVIANGCQTATYIGLGLAHPRWKCPPWWDPATGTCIDSESCNCVTLGRSIPKLYSNDKGGSQAFTYDIETDTWTPSPWTTGGQASTVVGDLIYIVDNVGPNILTIDIATGAVLNTAPLATVVHGLCYDDINGVWYGLVDNGVDWEINEVDPVTGALTLFGMPFVGEPIAGALACYNGQFFAAYGTFLTGLAELFPLTGTVVDQGVLFFDPVTGLTFDDQGTLWYLTNNPSNVGYVAGTNVYPVTVSPYVGPGSFTLAWGASFDEYTYTGPATPTVFDATSGDPIAWEACWYHPAEPCSGEFLGVAICTRTISQDYGRKVNSVRYGAILGEATRGGIEITYTAWLVASSEAGAAYGHRWLQEALGNSASSCASCADGSLTFLEHCECEGDSGVRRLTRAALTSEVEDITPETFNRCAGKMVQWTMVAEVPWVFESPVNCLTNATFAGCQLNVCVPVCPPGGSGPCGDDCLETIETLVFTSQRPRTECNLLVYPDGETCPEIASEDYSECTWLPVPTAYPTSAVVDTNSTVLITDGTECVDCPIRLSIDEFGNLSWEPLPGFDWHTINDPIDYDACCPKVLEVCLPPLEFRCAVDVGLTVTPQGFVDLVPLINDGDYPSYWYPDGGPWPTPELQQLFDYMACIGTTIGSTSSGGGIPANDIQAIIDAAVGVVGFPVTGATIVFVSPCDIQIIPEDMPGGASLPADYVFINLENITGVAIPGASCSYNNPIDFTLVCSDAPSGPVCCNIELDPNHTWTADAPVTDIAAAVASGRCTFTVNCPEPSGGGTTVDPPVCPKVVHIVMTDPADPASGFVTVPPGQTVEPADTVIIDNNPDAPIPITTTINRPVITCGNPCITYTPGPRHAPLERANCWCHPIMIARRCKTLPPLPTRSQVVSFTVRAGAMDLRNMRIRWWANPQGLPDYDADPASWECRTPCATAEIPYIARGAALIYDGTVDSTFYRCGGADLPGDSYIFGAGGGLWTPPVVVPGVPLIMCIEVDGLQTSPSANVDVTLTAVRALVPTTA
jgi:hypothetical protein